MGNITIGNISLYLPKLIGRIHVLIEGKENNPMNFAKHIYLILLSLSHVFHHLQVEDSEFMKHCETYMKSLWEILFQVCESLVVSKSTNMNGSNSSIDPNRTVSGEESSQSIIAECISRLSTMNPEFYLNDLRAQLSSPNTIIRSVVVSALKFTLATVDDEPNSTFHSPVHHNMSSLSLNSPLKMSRKQNEGYLFQNLIPSLINVMNNDADLTVRRLTLTTMNTALHVKPNLVVDHFESILNAIYNETNIREEWIHTVDMGNLQFS